MIEPIQIAKKALSIPLDNLNEAVKMGVPFVLLLTGLFVYQDYSGDDSIGGSGGLFIAEVFIAFYWHRFVLLNENNLTWSVGDENQKKKNKMISKGSSRFILVSGGFFISYLVFIVIFPMLIGLIKDNPSTFLKYGLTFVFALVAIPYILRLALIFPAIAIGHSSNNLKEAWKSSEDETAKIFISYFLVLGGLAIIYLILGFVLNLFGWDNLSLIQIIFINILVAIINVYGTMAWASLNSTLFMALHDDIEDGLILNTQELKT